MTAAPAGGRHRSRERALSILYEADTRDAEPAAVLEAQADTPDAFTAELVTGVADHRDELDAIITEHARGWTLARMPVLDRAVLRLGAFELVHQPDVPTGVVLSEAADLAAAYSTDDSSRFVNGLLAAVATEVRGGDGAPPA